MKRLILSLFVALAMTLPLRADDPKPAAGTVIQVTGKPKMSMDGKTFAVIKEGDAINAGAMIRTGKGKLSILLSDGSTVRLAENTEITLKSHDPEVAGGGSIFSLAKGIGRFLVNHIGAGKHFRVETPNAVAAVKGTDWGIETDGNQTKAMVFETKTNSSIEFGSLTDLQKTIIKENEQGGFDGKSFTHDEFTKEQQQEKNEKFKELILGNIKKDEAAATTAKKDDAPKTDGDKDKDADKPKDTDKDLGLDLGKIVGQELDKFNDKMGKDEKIENNDKTNALQEGRLVIDRNGYQAMVSNRIDRPSTSSVVKTVIVDRKAGPNAGQTGAVEATTFHAPIGDDWYAAMQMTIFDATNQEPNGYPLNWRTAQSFLAFNPQGDTLEIKSDYEVPRFLGYVPSPPCVQCLNALAKGPVGYTALDQGITTDILANGNLIGHIGYTVNNPSTGTVSSGTYPVAYELTLGMSDYYCTSCGDIIQTPDHNPYNGPATLNADGSASYIYGKNYGIEMFTMTLRELDDLGRTYAATGSPTGISDFHGLKDQLSPDNIRINVNLTITSQYFGAGHEIDLIFLPGFFDAFEFLTVPTNFQGSCVSCG